MLKGITSEECRPDTDIRKTKQHDIDLARQRYRQIGGNL